METVGPIIPKNICNSVPGAELDETPNPEALPGPARPMGFAARPGPAHQFPARPGPRPKFENPRPGPWAYGGDQILRVGR